MIANHQAFQLHFRTHSRFDKNAIAPFRDHPFYEKTLYFCEYYDQNCFDPDYPSLPLETFEPMLRRVFARGIQQRLEARFA
jgi:hypothetical protein